MGRSISSPRRFADRGWAGWEGRRRWGPEVGSTGCLVGSGARTGLPAWNDAHRHADVVVEVKMPGDHLHPLAIRRAELRRAAWHVRRTEKQGPHWEGSVGLWHVAPHVPEVLRRLAELHPLAPGCYAIGSPSACSLDRANELRWRTRSSRFHREIGGKLVSSRRGCRAQARRLDQGHAKNDDHG